MGELDEFRRAFESLVEPLEDMEKAIRSWLEGAVRDLALVEPRVTSRVKKPHSFVLKILTRERRGEPWDDPLAQSTDKVGARVDVVFRNDIDKIRQRIESATDVFEILAVDDKLEKTLQADRLGYNGVHIDVRLRDLPPGIASEHAVCEIQLRTIAQAAWATAGHDLTYKAPVELSVKQLRRMNRLTALLELFDDEVQHAVSDLMGVEGYPVATVIRALEEVWMHHVAERYNRALTRDIVTAIVGDDLTASDADELQGQLRAFRERWSDRLDDVYASPFIGSPLKAQPESMLVFYELEHTPSRLQQRWVAAGLDHRLLDELATLWGKRLPSPR
jgi:ppGpp synthetase/RelA/SpoT-type nucleotidyltranferase